MRRRSADIHDVARRAGVSTATVSRALNRPSAVAVSTRARISEAIEAIGWTPNASASSLRNRRSRRLLVLVPDFTDGLFGPLLQAIERAAAARSYSIIVAEVHGESAESERQLEIVRRHVVDGLIIAGHVDPDSERVVTRRFVTTARSGGVPVVVAMEPAIDTDTPSIRVDDAVAGAEVMNHLAKLGHRRLAIVRDDTGSSAADARVHGAEERLNRTADARLVRVMSVAPTIEGGREAGSILIELESQPTAIFCCTDELALGVLDAARRARLHVPRDISVVGFNDIQFAQLAVPPLTTVAQPVAEIGERSVRMVTDAIEGRSIHPSCARVSHRMVVRESTSRPSARRDSSGIQHRSDRCSNKASVPDESAWPGIVPRAQAIVPQR